MSSGGIKHILNTNRSLEEYIVEYINAVPTAEELETQTEYQVDIKGIRRRRQLIAILDAIYDYAFDAHSINETPTSVTEAFNAASDLRRDFKHDSDRLDNGHAPEIMLKRDILDRNETSPAISDSRKELILWLAVIHLWHKTETFPSQASLLKEAAKKTGRTTASLKTQLSNIANGKSFSAEEKEMFLDFIDDCEKAVKASGGQQTSFLLLLPAARAISAARRS